MTPWLLLPVLVLLPWPFVFGAAVGIGLLAWLRDQRRLGLGLIAFGIAGALLLLTPILGTISLRLLSWSPLQTSSPLVRVLSLAGGMSLVAVGGVSVLATPALLLRVMGLARALPDPLPREGEP